MIDRWYLGGFARSPNYHQNIRLAPPSTHNLQLIRFPKILHFYRNPPPHSTQHSKITKQSKNTQILVYVAVLLHFYLFPFINMWMLGTFPKAFSQVATSKMFNFLTSYFQCLLQPQRSAHYSVLAAMLGPHCSLRRLRRPNLTFGKLSLGKLHIWEVAFGKMSLGKYLNTDYNLA